jgi:hypothetical protein
MTGVAGRPKRIGRCWSVLVGAGRGWTGRGSEGVGPRAAAQDYGLAGTHRNASAARELTSSVKPGAGGRRGVASRFRGEGRRSGGGGGGGGGRRGSSPRRHTARGH